MTKEEWDGLDADAKLALAHTSLPVLDIANLPTEKTDQPVITDARNTTVVPHQPV